MVSGSVAVVITCMVNYIFQWPQTMAIVEHYFALVSVPAILPLFVLAYALRGARLLIMYTPASRKRWSYVLSRSFSFFVLATPFFMLEAISAVVACLYGRERSVHEAPAERDACSFMAKCRGEFGPSAELSK